jgi:hypothetical protein
MQLVRRGIHCIWVGLNGSNDEDAEMGERESYSYEDVGFY